MATYKITPIEKIEATDVLKQDFDFKTLYNMEFTSQEDNVQLLKKMCLLLYNEVVALKHGVKK